MQNTFSQEQLGAFSVSPTTGVFEIATYETFVMTVRIGSLGMDDRGSVRFVFHGAKDYTAPQTRDPKAPGYVTGRTSSGRPLDLAWSPFLNERPWFNTLEARLVEGGLAPGDEIAVVLGDRSGGSPGFRLQTYCQDRFKFRALVNPFSTQQFFELADLPSIEIGPGPGHRWMAVVPTLRRAGEPFRLDVKCEDAWGNPSDRIDRTVRFRPSAPVTGLPEESRFAPGAFSLSLDGLSVVSESDLTIDVLDEAGEVLCVTNPLRIAAPEEGRRHYWGDLHGQTEETVGTNSARRYFEFARDKAFLDVAGHQGNDFQISDAFWAELNRLTAEFDEPGRFLAVPGYEWSGNTLVGGDRNVWYRSEGRPIRRSHRALVMESAAPGTDCGTARELFDTLVREGEDVAVAAHCGGRYADIVQAHDGRVENSVEIHSAWGTFEWILRDAFEQGYRVGIVGNSDGHKGRPGASYPGDSFFTSMGGLTCFLMPELDRDHLFEAMRRRHHYATSGARIFLDVRAEFDDEVRVFHRDPAVFGADAGFDRGRHAIMGDIVGIGTGAADRDDGGDGRVHLTVDAIGSCPIERVDLFDGTALLETVRPNAPPPGEATRRHRVVWQGARYRGRGRNLAWNGEVRVEGNAVERFAPINFWSPDNQPSQSGPDRIAFHGLTAGNLQGLDLSLVQAGTGRLAFTSERGSAAADLGALARSGRGETFEGLDVHVAITPVDESGDRRGVSLNRELAIGPSRDARLYARVTQMDGHQAWSSPIYLVRDGGRNLESCKVA